MPGAENVTAVLESFLLGNEEISEASLAYLEKNYSIKSDKKYSLSLVFFGDVPKKSRQEIDAMVRRQIENYSRQKYYTALLEMKSEIVYIFPDKFNPVQLEKYCINGILKYIREAGCKNAILGWTVISRLGLIKEELDILRGELKWSIVLGEDVLISYPKTKQIKFNQLQYPYQIERSMVTALSSKETSRIERTAQEFLGWWRKEFISPIKSLRHLSEWYLQ